MGKLMPVVTAIVLLVGTAVGHGLRTDRWGKAKVLEEAGRPLERIPTEIGDWSGTDVTIDDRQLEIAEVSAYQARRYRHRPTGREALILILCGRPGAIGAHTPDICYPGAGFALTAKTTRRVIKRAGTSIEMQSTQATKEGASPENLSIWWSWSKDLERWEAPDLARWHFALAPVLYKVYLVRRLDSPRQVEDEELTDLSDRLMEQVLRSLR